MKLEEGFRTPNLEGKVFKVEEIWKTTTSLPTIRSATIIDTPKFLKPGAHICFDLLTLTGGCGNTYIAFNVKNFERKSNQKLKPKQIDKFRKKRQNKT